MGAAFIGLWFGEQALVHLAENGGNQKGVVACGEVAFDVTWVAKVEEALFAEILVFFQQVYIKLGVDIIGKVQSDGRMGNTSPRNYPVSP